MKKEPAGQLHSSRRMRSSRRMQGMQGMQGMMGMMNMMGKMDPAQMNRMMENCNKMMESDTSPSQPSGAQPKKS